MHETRSGITKIVLDGSVLAWRFDGRAADIEASWDAHIDRLFQSGLRPAEQPYRSEGQVAYYQLELL